MSRSIRQRIGIGVLALLLLLGLSACGQKSGTFLSTWAGETLEFGSYPQSRVTDEALLNALNAALSLKKEWTSFGYFLLSRPADYMWYSDVLYEGERYRCVYLEKYRPKYPGANSAAHLSEQDENGYKIGQAYWFKFEPIVWQVLARVGESLLLLSEKVLDAMQYDAGENNAYADSDLSGWQNGTFEQWAFGVEEQDKILVDRVDNSAESTWKNAFGKNPFAGADSNEGVFALSYAQVNEAGYGFLPGAEGDGARARLATDYARIQGVQCAANGCAPFWLRSPYHNAGNYACIVDASGAPSRARVNYTVYGVCPALRLRAGREVESAA